MVKHGLRVTSWKLKRVTSSNPRVTSSNPWVQESLNRKKNRMLVFCGDSNIKDKFA